MINLFFVIHDYSGARTYANELLDYLSTIDKISIHKIYYQSKYYKEYNVIPNGKITEIHLPPTIKIERSNEKYAARCINLMQPLLREKNNIVFHLNFSNQIKLGIKAKEVFGAKIIYTLHFLPDYFSHLGHNNEWMSDHFPEVDALEREAVLEVDHIICVTRFAKEVLCRFYGICPDKINTIHNGFSSLSDERMYSVDSTKLIRKEFGFTEDEKIILFVGLLEHRKGVTFLVRAFNRLNKIAPNTRLVIAGDGDFLQALGDFNKCWAKVSFTGKIPLNELEKLYSIATVGVIPSLYEQCSYVALEMMKHGLPVVVTGAPGLNELYLEGNDALVVPLHKADNGLMKLELKEEELLQALSIILFDKKMRKKLSSNARSKWKDSYTAYHMGNATLNQYVHLINASE